MSQDHHQNSHAKKTCTRAASKRLRSHKNEILLLWEERTRSLVPTASQPEPLTLIDSVPRFLTELAKKLDALHSDAEIFLEERKVGRELSRNTEVHSECGRLIGHEQPSDVTGFIRSRQF